MPRFTSAPVVEVVQQKQVRPLSQRKMVQAEYQRELQQTIRRCHVAVVVDLEDGDTPLTVRNRLKRAAEQLGITDLVIRRRGSSSTSE